MHKIEKVNENNKQKVIDFLRTDIIRHVFAYYDIQYEPDKTVMYTASENRILRGYILIYSATDFPSVILECEEDVAERLIAYTPENHFIIHTKHHLLPIIKQKFPHAKHYVENWMLVKKGEANFYESNLIHRLRTEDDASKLAMLLSSREDRTPWATERYLNWISKMPVFGVTVNTELVSYAGSFLQLPQVWMIGGVYTNPEHRNKGYATLATSAVTQEALKNAETAALFVRLDNYSAIKAYEKIAYKKIGEKLWVDVGTGQIP